MQPRRAADAEQDRVEVPLAQPVVPLNDAGLSIDVRPGILGLAVLFQDAGSHLKDHGDQLEQRIVLEARSRETELALRHVARVGLTQHGVTVARNHLTGLERVPQSHGDQFLGRLRGPAVLLLELDGPIQDFLVRKSVQRASKSVEAGGISVIGIGQRRVHQVRGVRGNVAGLVVGVQDEVHAGDILVFLALANHFGEVRAHVQRSRSDSGNRCDISGCR